MGDVLPEPNPPPKEKNKQLLLMLVVFVVLVILGAILWGIIALTSRGGTKAPITPTPNSSTSSAQ